MGVTQLFKYNLNNCLRLFKYNLNKRRQFQTENRR